MPEKIIRDPVHDVIAFDLGDDADSLIFRLIATAEVQRLRRIRQLGLASLAYPGADHSRYSHSLGVFETARKILARLARQIDIDPAERTACLVAALLHDLGHGPFSHVFERVSGIHHEDFTNRLILDPDSEVHQTLISFDKTLPETVIALLACRHERSWLCDILSSELDADRLDYLLRDNLMTGSRYGDYDLAWLLQAMTLAPGGPSGGQGAQNWRLGVGLKGISALEAYLQARYHMYRNVYFHKVVRAAEGMVKLALQRAKRLAVAEDPVPLEAPAEGENVLKALTGDRLSAGDFRELDDISVMGCFKAWARSEDAILAQLCGGLLHRRLYKTIDLSGCEDPAGAADAARRAVHDAGGDETYDLFYDNPANAPYKLPLSDDLGAAGILIVSPDGSVRDFADTSPHVRALAAELSFHRLHVAEHWRDTAERAVRAC